MLLTVSAIARDAAFGNTSLAQLPNIDQSPAPGTAVRMFPKNGTKSMAIKKSDLCSSIWASCNKLRGMPERDLDALAPYWSVLPSARTVLFQSAGRPDCAQLRLPLAARVGTR
ncbi:MAG: hypothetical protein EBY17_26780 [Acidobacteriia bacterium]|nr:hypothetical protein [Terriglobia bacterium]